MNEQPILWIEYPDAPGHLKTPTDDDLLKALGVNTDDLQRFRSHMESDCCQWISGNQVMVDKDLHNAMWRVLDALTGWSDDE